MVKHGKVEVLKWAALVLGIVNLMIWEASWLRKHGGTHQESHADGVINEDAALKKCQAQTHCPSIECTKTDLQRCTSEIQRVEGAATSEAAAAKQLIAERDQQIKKCDAGQKQDKRAVSRSFIQGTGGAVLGNPRIEPGSVLLLTPAKNAGPLLDRYFSNLQTLTYPRSLISLAFIVSDSLDYSAREIRRKVSEMDGEPCRDILVLQRDYGYAQAPDPKKVATMSDELFKRQILARSRNYLLSFALRDQEWALHIDVDIVYTPPTLIQDMLGYKKAILVTNCVYLDDGGAPVVPSQYCDGNSWAETDASREYLKTADPEKPLLLDYEGDAAFKDSRKRLGKFSGTADSKPVPLDGVGAHVLLVKADLHREGLVFPSSLVEHEIESEGFAKLAKAIGYQPYGLPDYVVHHAKPFIKPLKVW